VVRGRASGTLLSHGLENLIGLWTLSKRSAMTGYRSGFMAGDERLIDALKRFRPSLGNATPDFIQAAAIAAWNDDTHTPAQRDGYGAKRKLFLAEFARRDWKVEASEATFYLWMRAPGGDDVGFVESLLKLGIVTTPGSFLGSAERASCAGHWCPRWSSAEKPSRGWASSRERAREHRHAAHPALVAHDRRGLQRHAAVGRRRAARRGRGRGGLARLG
jgi:aspartate/methionine/tyrosine aminotransferase